MSTTFPFRRIFLKSFFCTTAFVFANSSFAQKGIIGGKVKDEKNLSAPGVTIRLLHPDSSVQDIVQTDSAGLFQFSNEQKGIYFIEATSVGMKRVMTRIFSYDGDSLTVPNIKMAKDVTQLKEVVVKNEKQLMETTEGKIVYNVEKSISASGSSAFDQLTRTPGISITQDEDLLLKGSPNVNVMIDGKPTYLSAQQLSILLKSIPAENLKSIEIIAIPSSQYDAGGNAGIINIITKKSVRQGYALNASAGVGTGRYVQTAENITGNIKTKYFNVFGNYNYSYNHSYLHRTSYRIIDSTAYDRISYDPSMASDHGYKAGIDVYLNKDQQMGIVYNGYSNKWSRDAGGPTYLRELDGKIDSVVLNHNITNEPSRNNSFNLNYQGKLDTTGSSISADADYARYINNSYGTQGNQFLDVAGNPLQPYQELKLQQPSIITIRSLKADAALAIYKTKLAAGIKYAYVTTDNNFTYDSLINSQYLKSNTLSNHFVYKEKVSAAYVSANREWKTITANAGLRVEQTNSEGSLLTGNLATKRKYTDLFPFVSVAKTINSRNKIDFSFSRRINRPVYNNLNPSRYFFDKYSYYQGNPNLRPEYSWTTALSYSFEDKCSATLSYVRTLDAVLGFAQQDTSTGDLVVSGLNFSHKDNVGLLLIAPIAIGEFWEMQNTLNVSYVSYIVLIGTADFNAHKFIADINTVQNFKLPGKMNFELMAQYRSPILDGVYVNKYYFTVNGGAKRSFLDNKLDVKLSFTDLFKTVHFWGYSIYDGANVRYDHTPDSRRMNINFSYHFGGKLSAGSEHRLDEQDRL